MKVYTYIAKMRIERALAYRFQVISAIFFQGLLMFAAAFFWKALYADSTAKVSGVGQREMLIYTILATFITCLLQVDVENRMIDGVRKGSIAMDMIKPVNLFGTFFAEDLGKLLVVFIQNALPLLIIGALFIQIPVPASAFDGLLAFLSFVISYLINWLFAAVFGMWAFTAISIRPMIEIKKHFLALLSGAIIPIWFFPQWLQNILNVLPFRYIYQLPLSIYIGKLDRKTTFVELGIQIVWLVAFFLLFSFCSRRVTKKVLVQGG